MTKTNIIILFLLCFALPSAVISQQTGGRSFISNDSLPVDGAYSNINNITSCTCPIKILSQKGGPVWGTECITKISSVCGEKDTVQYTKTRILSLSAKEVADGDTIRTGDFDDAGIRLQLSDGKIIEMGRNASLIVDRDHCKNPMTLHVHYGLVYLDLTHGDKDKTIAVQTGQGIVVNKGTRFTVEITKDGDTEVEIVRVYEGSVEFKMNTANSDYKKSNKDKDAAMKQLTEDYKNGKITASEFTQKSMELSQDVVQNSVPKTVTIEAGYESRINGFGNPTDPVAFDTASDPGK